MQSSTGVKKDELARVLSKYEETIKMLESKSNEMQQESELITKWKVLRKVPRYNLV